MTTVTVSATALPTLGGRKAREVRAWPEEPVRRTVLQFLLALPFASVVFIAAGSYGSHSPNAALIRTMQHLHYADTSLNWMPKLTPIIPAICAAVLHDRLLMSLLGALVAGYFLQTIMELLHQRRVPLWYQLVIIGAVSLNPVFIFQATQNFSMFLGITAFIIALMHMVRFIEWGSTFHGIATGTLLTVSAFSDRNGWLYPLILLAIMPIMKWWRRGERGAGYATITVVFFPVLVTAFSLLAVNWIVANINPFTEVVRYLHSSSFANMENITRLPVPISVTVILPVVIMAVPCILGNRLDVLAVTALAIVIELVSVSYGFVDFNRIGLSWFTVIGMYLAFVGAGKGLWRILLGLVLVLSLNATTYLIALNSTTLVMPFVHALLRVVRLNLA